ncbi:CopG family ribbon-helix-helix protein [Pseudoxanthomonas mexicana]
MKRHISVRLDPALYEQMKLSAKQRGTSVSEVIAAAVSAYLSQNDEQLARIEGLSRRVDDNHASVIVALDRQLIQLGELIAMVLAEPRQGSRIASSSADMAEQIRSIQQRKQMNQPT